MKTALKSILADQKFVCTTCDVWSSRTMSFLGITVHYLNERFIRKSYVLAFRFVIGRQSYDVLSKILTDVFKEYGITIEKITHVVTDGGSAFCKAFRIYGTRNDEIDSEIENEEMMIDEEEESSQELPFIQANGEHFYSNEIDFDTQLNPNSMDDILNGTIDDESNEYDEDEDAIETTEISDETFILPPQKRCLSHLLNLIPGDFKKDLLGTTQTAYVCAFSKLHSLWVSCRRSSIAKTRCKEMLERVLSIPCATRWNSEFDCTNKTYQVKDKVNPLIKQLKTELKSAKNLQLFNNNDWIVIEEYLRIMRPVACALDKLQSEQNGSQGYILPTLIAMRHHICTQSTRPIAKEFSQIMLKMIDKRFKNHFKFDRENKELILAAVTLPKFKCDFIQDDNDLRFARNLLIDECCDLSTDHIQNTTPETSSNNVELDDFYVSFGSRPIRQNSVENRVEAEVLKYIDDERKNDEMLNEYPSVRNVYFRHNTTLSASAAVERVFSQCQMIFAPRRNKLSPENFERTLLLKCNKDLRNKIHH